MTHIHKDYPLIDSDQLITLLNHPNVKIFDVRGQWSSPPVASIDDYQRSHIPGAIFLDWTDHFLETDIETHLAPVASRKKAQQAFVDLGINSNDTIVLYDDCHHMLAGRVWWSMRYWGFVNVKVLNGGWRYWQQNHCPTSVEIPKIDKGTYTVAEQNQLMCMISDVEQRADDVSLIDARGPVYFQGKQGDRQTGHIPGAINVPYALLLDEKTGCFKNQNSLINIFDDKLKQGINTTMIASCGSGYAATVVLLALKSMGIDAPLFDGSFSIWKHDESRPTEQGAQQFG